MLLDVLKDVPQISCQQSPERRVIQVFLINPGARAALFAVIVILAIASSAKGASTAGSPLDLQINSSAKPGTVDWLSKVPIRVTVRNTGPSTITRLQVSLWPDGRILNANRPLKRRMEGGPIWNVGPLHKGQTKTLTLTVEVGAPKEPGDLSWCFDATAAPKLSGWTAWRKSEWLCYGYASLRP